MNPPNPRITMNDTERKEWRQALDKRIKDRFKKFDDAKKLWSKCYNFSLFGSILFSAMAALALKLNAIDESSRSDLGAVLATFAAILGTMTAAGGFERRYRAARQGKTALFNLRLQLDDPRADLDAVNEKLQKVSEDYDTEVIDVDALQPGKPNT